MISVCIATYNGQKYIKEQIASILLQISENDEIIISDDSSTDNTVQIILSFNDHRIKLLPICNFHSSIFNFENALKQAKGDIIFLADQDDIWNKHKVEKCMIALQNADLVLHDAEVIDIHGKIILQSIFEYMKSRTGFFHNLIKNSYMGCCMAFRANVLQWILPFPAKIPMHDLWIGEIVELKGNTCLLPQKLIKDRRHDANVSTTIGKSKFSLWKRIQYRLILIAYLIKRYYK
jgi:glycosyltransferase involved in cell wall biosynthesis